MQHQQNNRLSINRFNMIDPYLLSDEEWLNYVFAKMMANIISRIEGIVPASEHDRIFKRAKYDLMSIVHDARDELDGQQQKEQVPHDQ